MSAPFAAPEAPPSSAGTGIARTAIRRAYLLCRPEHFTVSYSINPWMHPDTPTDTALAVRQWEALRDTYLRLGHRVELLDPMSGLADMVFTANGAVTVDGLAYLACFAHPQRQPESAAYRSWFPAHGFAVHEPSAVNEGEGDFAYVGGLIVAGSGYRSTIGSHAELERTFGREVLSVILVDPKFYHLDVAFTVLDSEASEGLARVAYLPSAFDSASQDLLAERFPGAILVSEAEAEMLALNSVSDGRNVVVASGATDYIRQLSANGYTPVPVDLSELLKGGGGIKCCTQELRRSASAAQ